MLETHIDAAIEDVATERLEAIARSVDALPIAVTLPIPDGLLTRLRTLRSTQQHLMEGYAASLAMTAAQTADFNLDTGLITITERA